MQGNDAVRKAGEYGLPDTGVQIKSITNMDTYKTEKHSDSLSFNLKTFTFIFLLCKNELGHCSRGASRLLLHTRCHWATAAGYESTLISGKTVVSLLHGTFLLQQVAL